MKIVGMSVLCLMGGLVAPVVSGERLVVHEWGTFTSFQNESGEALRRINTDDEPVPGFVHQMAKAPPECRVFPPTELIRDIVDGGGQGAPPADLRVRMRLETPVLYFHLPDGTKSMTVDVEVDFRQGFLTQFFPQAEATVNSRPIQGTRFPLGEPLFSTLKWSGVKVGTAGTVPESTEHVWLAQRDVDAAPVMVEDESERFLFYRGVGTLEAPLRVIRHDDQTLEVRTNSSAMEFVKASSNDLDHTSWNRLAHRRSWWLVEVLPDGRAAFRRPSPVDANDPELLSTVSGTFTEREFSSDNLIELRQEMHQALVMDGLNPDEAQALLSTWELSYFHSPGQRLFFIVPPIWTDAVLPLRLSVPAYITRVMVGRIELVSPRQRELMRQILEMPLSDLTEVLQQVKALQKDPTRREVYNSLASGRGDSSVLGIPVPPIYQAFLDLGRFRTSLVLDSIQRHRTDHPGEANRLMQLEYELLFPGKVKWD